ncbi:MAG: N-methyl-L-tryptophan oxidase [Chloroflexota bacterium]|nr:MAG: N-methyl-L-tryptophan oxidase [Chloroflexota bacterium]
MKQDYEYIVLGLGGLGSGAAYWLSRRAGREVLGLEQFETGHVRGGSQDHSRIIRLSYHTPEYVRLAKQAYTAWMVLEEEAGENLIVKTGGLDLWPAGSAIPGEDYTRSMQACDVPFERLDAAEIMRRWPQFRLTEDVYGLYQAESGIAPAARCNAAHQRMARANGATLLDNTPISAVRPLNGAVEVMAGGTTYRCRKLIIAAGAWTNNILAHFSPPSQTASGSPPSQGGVGGGSAFKLPLTVTQEQVTYFATPHLADFAPEHFPIWIWMDEPCFYGFPVYGEPATKAAQDVGGEAVTAETRSFEPNPANAQRVEHFLQKYIPSALGPVLYTKTCLYTMPPDRDFVIDTIPGYDHCSVAVGAGHAFKFASLLGKILSELAIDGRTESNLEPFKMDRPILQMENPPKSFMV